MSKSERFEFVLTPEQKAWLLQNGGSKKIMQWIDNEMNRDARIQQILDLECEVKSKQVEIDTLKQSLVAAIEPGFFQSSVLDDSAERQVEAELEQKRREHATAHVHWVDSVRLGGNDDN